MEKTFRLSNIRLIVWQIPRLTRPVMGGQVCAQQDLKLSIELIDCRTPARPDVEHLPREAGKLTGSQHTGHAIANECEIA